MFISHAHKDLVYIKRIYKLMQDIGIAPEQVFCTSVPGSDVKIDESFRNEIRTQFSTRKPHFIRVQSDNYTKSAICQNEAGAAWVLGIPFSTILLPGVSADSVAGIVDPSKIVIATDHSHDELHDKLSQLCSTLLNELEIQKPSKEMLYVLIDQFIADIEIIRKDQMRKKHEESVSKAIIQKRPSWL